MIKNCTYVNLGIIVSLANYKLLLTIALPFSSYWTEWWIIKQCPKGLQANGFFPVWVCSCLFKLLLSLIDLSHLEQANGFSPVWVRPCLFKLLFSLNEFLDPISQLEKQCFYIFYPTLWVKGIIYSLKKTLPAMSVHKKWVDTCVHVLGRAHETLAWGSVV